ncbi:MAG: DUF2335 domain-containing protein [Candidatus Nomurabacteria bacterium]|nr:DUF2335 domain-containing protein [Candidatus Nomurabacteria bacterium]
MSKKKQQTISRGKNSNGHEVVSIERRVFSGPLPHPDILKGFDDIVPGAAERIIKMAETQMTHRISIESRVINADIKSSKRGVIFGFIIAILMISAGVIITVEGEPVVGGIIMSTTLVSLVGVFVIGSRGQSKERVEKENKIQDRINLD